MTANIVLFMLGLTLLVEIEGIDGYRLVQHYSGRFDITVVDVLLTIGHIIGMAQLLKSQRVFCKVIDYCPGPYRAATVPDEKVRIG